MSLIFGDLSIASLCPLQSPTTLLTALPLSDKGNAVVTGARKAISEILTGNDQRLVVVVGPCSIHDSAAAIEYAEKLKIVAETFSDELLIVMRAYFEKPRTTFGWKGLINDPDLNGSFDVNKGLCMARKILIDLVNLGLPTATEFIDTLIPHYISDVISWAAIGARTTESQLHRELASGLPMPVGFKNGTDGNVRIAINAIRCARQSHHFLSINQVGNPVIVATLGNHKTHIILRGSHYGTNYHPAQVNEVINLLKEYHLPPSLMIDCSHGNSQKNHQHQWLVAEAIAAQLTAGSSMIHGVMLESNLLEGQQSLEDLANLVYGKSVTDACLSWEQTQPILKKLAKSIQCRNRSNAYVQRWG